ncbi:MAG: CBM9 family sugar-binding protein [Bacteroidia bacterium]|nr:CBM9 family sugar-binding protein [Bacteroidia bacterium]MBT8310339.1 CBM9 family sugar-binding protein [Bacteroidia bacterium]NNK27768.1 sugar-binding protein [Flavobacteriaceae bacterium]NNL59928.1 sugar-binding protein [Flavobacteriaceae bacterium]
MKWNVFFLLALVVALGCKNDQITGTIVKKASIPPSIDGIANDTCWDDNEWLALDQVWLGDPPSSEDFRGRYKLSWNEDALYLLVEITDDVLFDQNEDPLTLWWDDDCVEVFVDEDNSHGEHQYNHNAFAYHVAIDGNVVDLGQDKNPHLYNDHVISKRRTEGNISQWELSIKLFDDSFTDGGNNIPRELNAGETIGFALAYCDNDNSKQRENFIGSEIVEGEDKNRGWIDAGIFGDLYLQE